MNAKRLLLLADFLEKLPRKRFNFNAWVGTDWKGAKDLSCGTTACALGWATTIPALRRAGLQLRRHRESASTSWHGGYVAMRGMRLSAYGTTHISVRAAAKLFAISHDDAMTLFVPYEYPREKNVTPKQVAKRIRRFVDEANAKT